MQPQTCLLAQGVPAKTAYRNNCRGKKGYFAFTLIELLTVIAIIAILAAIIFPAFAGVQENVRRGNTMDSLRKLYVATKQYELDNRRYPEFLFGPALNADGTIVTANTGQAIMTPQQVASDVRATVSGGMDAATQQRIRNVQAAYESSLFPNYINDLSVYTCRNNPITSPSNNEIYVASRLVQNPNDPTQAEPVNLGFYRFDAYDVSPVITGNDTINLSQGVARYSRVWYPLISRAELEALSPADQELYKNQLVFRNPSSDTYLTMTSYHVPKGKIVVIWLNGAAKVLDTRKLDNALFQTTEPNVRDADFFKLTPTNY